MSLLLLWFFFFLRIACRPAEPLLKLSPGHIHTTVFGLYSALFAYLHNVNFKLKKKARWELCIIKYSLVAFCNESQLQQLKNLSCYSFVVEKSRWNRWPYVIFHLVTYTTTSLQSRVRSLRIWLLLCEHRVDKTAPHILLGLPYYTFLYI